jgi:hypothetical protein
MQKTLRYGIQKAAQAELSAQDVSTTIGQQIELLLAASQDAQINGQVRSALKDPQSIIEIRCGQQVQTVGPDTPLRELLSPEAGEVEITISKPHVGG